MSRHFETRIQVCKGLQDEPALVKPRVRDLQPGLLDRRVAVEQEIEVERAWALRDSGEPVAPERPLELQQGVEKGPSAEARLQLDGPIEEARLVDDTHGLGIAQGRDRLDLGFRQIAQPSDRGPQSRLPVSEIRAEGNEGADHPGSLFAGYSDGLAPRLLIVVGLFLASAAPAHADLVQLDRSHVARGAQLARAAGGTELARELRIWRVPAYAVGDLRRAGVVQRSRPERLLAVNAAALQATDPMVPLQWWIPVIGADREEAPGPGKPVTVVDSGIDLSHPEFLGRPNTTALNEQTIDEEDEDHGTEVSSVVAAPNNGVGITGVYPEAILRVWDASPFGFLNEGAAIQGIVEAARRGPGVINLSFGGEDDDPLLEDAISFAFRSGSLVVAAAGNEGFEGSPDNFPAFYPHVLTVGATNDEGRVAGFSTISPTVDLVAPGVRIPVAEPTSQDPSGYILVSGTSFASPLVSGSAAWVWTRRPDLDNTQLFELMRRSAVDIAEPGHDHASGYGLLSIPNALAARTPARDPHEPNEQPNEIESNGLFATGIPPLTRPAQTTSQLSAHVDRNEDPIDLYRLWAPAAKTLRVRYAGSVAVRLLRRSPRAERSVPLAVGKRGVAAYRNATKRGVYVYVEVRPAVARAADYTLRITAARR